MSPHSRNSGAVDPSLPGLGGSLPPWQMGSAGAGEGQMDNSPLVTPGRCWCPAAPHLIYELWPPAPRHQPGTRPFLLGMGEGSGGASPEPFNPAPVPVPSLALSAP